MKARRALVLGLWPFWLVISPAHAENPEGDLVQRGIQLRREHRDREALEAFRRAYDLKPSPRTRSQIALAEEALGQWAPAERDLAESLKAVDDVWIRSHVDLLRGALEGIRRRLGTLAIETNAADAEVWVNGALIGPLPVAPVRVAAGPIEVELRRPQHEAIRRTITVAPDSEVHLRVEVVESEAPPMANSQTASEPIGRTITPEPPAIPTSVGSPSPDPTPLQRTLAWGMLGGSAVLLTTAIGAQIVREQNVARYNDDASCSVPGTTRDQVCGVYRGRVESATSLAIACYIGAGALGIGSAVLFVTGRKAPPALAGLRMETAPDRVGAVYTGQF